MVLRVADRAQLSAGDEITKGVHSLWVRDDFIHVDIVCLWGLVSCSWDE